MNTKLVLIAKIFQQDYLQWVLGHEQCYNMLLEHSDQIYVGKLPTLSGSTD